MDDLVDFIELGSFCLLQIGVGGVVWSRGLVVANLGVATACLGSWGIVAL